MPNEGPGMRRVVVTVAMMALSIALVAHLCKPAPRASAGPAPTAGSDERGDQRRRSPASAKAAAGTQERSALATASGVAEDIDARVAQSRLLRKKAILSAEETAQLHALFSDSKVIRHLEGFLMNDRPTGLQPEDQRRRMDSVSFLVDALRWHDNPIRDEVLASFKAVILSDNYHAIEEPMARQSVAADRYELFLALDQQAPDDAARVVADSKSSPNAKLIAYAAGMAKKLNSHSN